MQKVYGLPPTLVCIRGSLFSANEVSPSDSPPFGVVCDEVCDTAFNVEQHCIDKKPHEPCHVECDPGSRLDVLHAQSGEFHCIGGWWTPWHPKCSHITCEVPLHTEISHDNKRRVGDSNSLSAKEKYYIVTGDISHRREEHRMKGVSVKCVQIPGTVQAEWRTQWFNAVIHILEITCEDGTKIGHKEEHTCGAGQRVVGTDSRAKNLTCKLTPDGLFAEFERLECEDLRCELCLHASKRMQAIDSTFADGVHALPCPLVNLSINESVELQCAPGYAVSGYPGNWVRTQKVTCMEIDPPQDSANAAVVAITPAIQALGCKTEMRCTNTPMYIGSGFLDDTYLTRRRSKYIFVARGKVAYECKDNHFIMVDGKRNYLKTSTCEVNTGTGLLEWSPPLDAKSLGKCQRIQCSEPFDEASELDLGVSPLVIDVDTSLVVECKRGFVAVYSDGVHEPKMGTDIDFPFTSCELDDASTPTGRAVTAHYTHDLKDFTCKAVTCDPLTQYDTDHRHVAYSISIASSNGSLGVGTRAYLTCEDGFAFEANTASAHTKSAIVASCDLAPSGKQAKWETTTKQSHISDCEEIRCPLMDNVSPVNASDLTDGARVNTAHKFQCGNSQRFSESKRKEATFWCILDRSKASASFFGEEYCEDILCPSLPTTYEYTVDNGLSQNSVASYRCKDNGVRFETSAGAGELSARCVPASTSADVFDLRWEPPLEECIPVTCDSTFPRFPNTRVLDETSSSYSLNHTLTYVADEGFHFAKSNRETFEHETSGEVVCALNRRESEESHAKAQTASWALLRPLTVIPNCHGDPCGRPSECVPTPREFECACERGRIHEDSDDDTSRCKEATPAHISIALLELAFHPTREWAAEVEQLWNDYLREISPQTQYRVVSLEEGDAMPHDASSSIIGHSSTVAHVEASGLHAESALSALQYIQSKIEEDKLGKEFTLVYSVGFKRTNPERRLGAFGEWLWVFFLVPVATYLAWFCWHVHNLDDIPDSVWEKFERASVAREVPPEGDIDGASDGKVGELVLAADDVDSELELDFDIDGELPFSAHEEEFDESAYPNFDSDENSGGDDNDTEVWVLREDIALREDSLPAGGGSAEKRSLSNYEDGDDKTSAGTDEQRGPPLRRCLSANQAEDVLDADLGAPLPPPRSPQPPALTRFLAKRRSTKSATRGGIGVDRFRSSSDGKK